MDKANSPFVQFIEVVLYNRDPIPPYRTYEYQALAKHRPSFYKGVRKEREQFLMCVLPSTFLAYLDSCSRELFVDT